MNSFTLQESAKQIGINLKTVFRWRHCFLVLSVTANINVLSGILEVDETFFQKSFRGKRYFLYIGKLEKTKEEEIKEKNESRS
ncbi:MAG: hypothetical protein ACTS73_07540 [Arsenophonus sp. NEOnobi-MAG3]